MPNPPRLTCQTDPDGPSVALHGRWSAAYLAAASAWHPLATALAQQTGGNQPVAWDLRGLERLDHTGAQLLWNTWGHQWPAQVLLHPTQRAMLERVEKFTVMPPPPQRVTVWGLYLGLGAWVMAIEGHLVGAVRLLGQLVLDLLHLLRAPQKGPWRDISGHLYRIGATALPITALVGFLIGVVLAYLMSRQLRQFGADAFIVNILGLSLIRELGPVLAAILIAGRSGSAITAQIGVMRVTEELDAMRVMGIAPGLPIGHAACAGNGCLPCP